MHLLILFGWLFDSLQISHIPAKAKGAYRRHEKVAGGTKTTSGWNSNEASAYPSDFNYYRYLAQAAAELVKQRRLNLPSPATAHTEEENSVAPTRPFCPCPSRPR